MCSALMDSLECYMDVLVDSFEHFIKKTLILLTVAIATIIAMFVYALRIITTRQVDINTSLQDLSCALERCSESLLTKTQHSNTKLKSKSVQSCTERCLQKDCDTKACVLQYSKSYPETCTTGANTANCPPERSIDEVLENIGFTNRPKGYNSSKTSLNRQYSATRPIIPSLPTYTKQSPTSFKRTYNKSVAAKTSCCSLCCIDDDQR